MVLIRGAVNRGRFVWLDVATAVVPAALGLVLVEAVSAASLSRSVVFFLVVFFGSLVVLRPSAVLPALLTVGLFDQALDLPLVGTLRVSDTFLVLAAFTVLIRWGRIELPRWSKAGWSFVIAGSMVAASQATQAVTAAWWDTLRWVAYFLVVMGVVSSARLPRRLPALWSAAGIVVSLGAIAQYAGFTFLVGAPYLSDRYDSFFGYYTVFAGFAALTTFLSTAFLFAPGGQVGQRMLYLTSALLGGVALVIADSRGGIASLAAALLALAGFGQLRVRQLAAGAAMLVALVVAVGTLAPSSRASLLVERFTTAQGGDVTRALLHSRGRELLVAHPEGIGYGQFGPVGGSIAGQQAFHSHDTLVQIGLDTGWVGLTGYCLVFIGPVVVAVRRRRHGRLSWEAAAWVAALVGITAQGLNDYLFYETAWGIAAVTTAAVATWHLADQPREREFSSSTDRTSVSS